MSDCDDQLGTGWNRLSLLWDRDREGFVQMLTGVHLATRDRNGRPPTPRELVRIVGRMPADHWQAGVSFAAAAAQALHDDQPCPSCGRIHQ